MKLIKILSACLTAISICFAANDTNVNYTISGIVTDTGNVALSGASVVLEKTGDTATTDINGNFTFSGNINITVTSNKQQKTSAIVHKILIVNGVLKLNIEKKSQVEIVSYTLQGQAVFKIIKSINAGIYSIALPDLTTGVCIYKVKVNGSEYVLKSSSIGKANAVLSSNIKESSTLILSKTARTVLIFNNVIAATKTGYLNYRVGIGNLDTSGIQIKMIASEGTVTDTDGNVYQTVQIGTQVWTVENWRCTKYNDGSAIPFVDTATKNGTYATTPKYWYYANTTNLESIKKYGALYNWYTVNTGKLAPTGWHVPTDSEWEVMQSYLVMHGYNFDGTTDTTNNKIAMALAAKTDWYSNNGAGYPGNMTKNNSSGFSALPGGYLSPLGFSHQSYAGFWWSATEYGWSTAWLRDLYYNGVELYRDSYGKESGYSVRLVKESRETVGILKK